MKLVVRGDKLTLTPSLNRYVDEKLLNSTKKLLGRSPAFDAATLNLEFTHSARHHKKGMVWEAEANLQLPGKQIFEHVTAEDIHTAIDDLEEVLKREIKKYKERSRSRLLRGARRVKQQFRYDRSTRISRTGRNRQEGN